MAPPDWWLAVLHGTYAVGPGWEPPDDDDWPEEDHLMAETYVTVVWETGPAGQKFLVRETPHGDRGDAEHDAGHARSCGLSADVEPRPR